MKRNYEVPLLSLLDGAVTLTLQTDGLVRMDTVAGFVPASSVLAALGSETALSYDTVLELRKLLTQKIRQRKRAVKRTHTMNEVIRSTGLTFLRQHKTGDVYVSKWHLAEVPVLRLRTLVKLLETDPAIESAYIEEEALVVRTTAKPTAIKFFRENDRFQSVQQSLEIPDCLL